jgi:hypothetical protein
VLLDSANQNQDVQDEEFDLATDRFVPVATAQHRAWSGSITNADDEEEMLLVD